MMHEKTDSGPSEDMPHSVPLMTVRMKVNGQWVQEQIEPRLLLADFLRGHLRLTGTHVGCEHGVCGACTILVNGDSVRSCLMLAVRANGCEVQTVESMGTLHALSPMQEAMREHHGLQCGFCTPGMLATCMDALNKFPLESKTEIREVLSGNLCRCTGYQGITEALHQCARLRDTLREVSS